MAKKTRPMQMLVHGNVITDQVVNGWLKSFDPDADEGRGAFEVTDDRSEALVFADLVELHELWTAQSTVLPLRPDGKPNRPLTAYTIEARPAELGTGVPWGRKNKRRGVR